jgi:hypothetical protein
MDALAASRQPHPIGRAVTRRQELADRALVGAAMLAARAAVEESPDDQAAVERIEMLSGSVGAVEARDSISALAAFTLDVFQLDDEARIAALESAVEVALGASQDPKGVAEIQAQAAIVRGMLEGAPPPPVSRGGSSAEVTIAGMSAAVVLTMTVIATQAEMAAGFRKALDGLHRMAIRAAAQAG